MKLLMESWRKFLKEAKVSKSVLKALRAWPKGWRGGESPGKYYGNFKKSDWTAHDKGYIEERGNGFYILSDLGREVLAANPPEEEKVNEQESGLPPGFEGFDIPDEPSQVDPAIAAFTELDTGDRFTIGKRKPVYELFGPSKYNKDSMTKTAKIVGTKGRKYYVVKFLNVEESPEVAAFEALEGTMKHHPNYRGKPGIAYKVE